MESSFPNSRGTVQTNSNVLRINKFTSNFPNDDEPHLSPKWLKDGYLCTWMTLPFTLNQSQVKANKNTKNTMKPSLILYLKFWKKMIYTSSQKNANS